MSPDWLDVEATRHGWTDVVAVDLELKRRVNWPDKKTLAKLVWEKPLIHAAKDLGVSDVALRKHCVKVGIELPRQGHWVKR